jgi:hypothetical protein
MVLTAARLPRRGCELCGLPIQEQDLLSWDELRLPLERALRPVLPGPLQQVRPVRNTNTAQARERPAAGLLGHLQRHTRGGDDVAAEPLVEGGQEAARFPLPGRGRVATIRPPPARPPRGVPTE